MGKINYGGLKEIECQYCKVIFKPTGPAQKNCPTCTQHVESVNSQVKRDILRYEKFGTYEFLGKGSSTKSGPENHCYKHGISSFNRGSKCYKNTVRYCERCGEDLKYASRYHYAVHHRDHDRAHNDVSNWELLCKRCHQIHHGCIENLQKVK